MEIIWGLDLNEVITVGIALLAIIVSVWDRILNNIANKKSNKKAEEAIRLSQGISEMELRNSISSARSKINEFSFELKKFKSDKPKEDYSSLEKIFRSILEDYFNHYDRGCRLYLDKKIDRKSFKKEYKKEIKNIIENKNYGEYFDPKKKRYKAILKVYKKWNK
ncbi:hypothetical protein OOZ15_12430 [Galbibacter sp. EGI 63066]|uniref:hypothetical protein n=1 Tax=Galbibacter sp. EGI 63066 TaxID=2993559 RepID=UPI0022489F53|nr:hypothetical protein [Galbibacter sp. EGI 63066]MCX2680751.1 hypothetical protein [Galbibacter sp. EGI 63066]